ncbi:hypothetical protein [Shewanella gelidii]|uniref:Uncharacterized protein n=1 Tax=Shewanella gelidii TaxID=1642821 RepID=A0A917JUG4_9GAMM|nr:hypothetical protein [Shewanella gelidii]MCL1098560.1 hypothetical protein [Shewanella gelidii]GGI87151.1 hypothetical protein GCM10009332_25520 [Shewanella gelidii]
MKKGKFLQILLTTLSVAGWAFAIYALIIFGEARPDRAVGYYLSKGAPVRLDWDPELTLQLEYIIWACAGISFVSLALNFYTVRATKEGYWVNIPLLLVSSLAAGLYIRYVV